MIILLHANCSTNVLFSGTFKLQYVRISSMTNQSWKCHRCLLLKMLQSVKENPLLQTRNSQKPGDFRILVQLFLFYLSNSLIAICDAVSYNWWTVTLWFYSFTVLPCDAKETAVFRLHSIRSACREPVASTFLAEKVCVLVKNSYIVDQCMKFCWKCALSDAHQ